MEKMVFIMVLVSLMNMLRAEIGWSGNIWPNSETFNLDGTNITVYYQIWKEGVTDQLGQGVDISAKLYYKLSTAPDYVEVNMPFLGDIDNNNEYSVDIPDNYFTDNDIIQFYCEGFDSTDNSFSYGTDQNGAGPFDSDNPGNYYIGSPTSQDVTVTFQVNMSLEATITDVSVAGTFNNWTSGQNLLADPDQDLIFTAEVLFTAGSNPAQEYKFVNGTTWEEEIANRSFIIDYSSPTQILDVVYFNNHDPENYLSQNVAVTFNVDVSDSVNAGAVFNSLGINGNLSPLDWEFNDLNNSMNEIEDNIWTITLTFSQGASIYLEFKFARDGNDWEAGFEENHQVTIDDSGTAQVVDCVYGEMGALSIDNWNIIPESMGLIKNYPNPFNPSTTISFSIPSMTAKHMKISIFNLAGQSIEEYSMFGNQSTIIWNAENQTAGIYFAKLFVENEKMATQKMILLK